MAREEAIETLKANYPDACFEQLREAVDAAISALQAQDVPETNVGDMISRKAAIELKVSHGINEDGRLYIPYGEVKRYLEDLPPAQPERDIPVKPTETTDHAWGIPKRQAVCPKCDYYLGNIAFLGGYKGKKITYCETCGQAIDWEGWDFNDE